MIKKYILSLILLLSLGWAGYKSYDYFSWYKAIENNVSETDYKSGSNLEKHYTNNPTSALKPILAFKDNFTLENFKNTPTEYQPWTRWSWPGNDVSKNEITRELILLKKNGFGGAEIQAFSTGINHHLDSVDRAKVFSVNSDSYVQHINWAINKADSLELKIDLTTGSGWPAGGGQIAVDDNIKTLLYGEELITGGKQVSIEVPTVKMPFSYYFFGVLQHLTGNDVADYIPQAANLMAVVASKVVENNRSIIPYNLNDQIELDAESTVILTDVVKNGVINWNAPEGRWCITSIYTMPNGEKPSESADFKRGLVLDHFDSTKVIANYNYLFNSHTNENGEVLKGFNGFFNDSFEFKVDRHVSSDFIQQFKKLRGYDITPWLPSVLTPTYDSFFFDFFQVKASPEYKFSALDRRIRYDYTKTISDLFISRYIDASTNWGMSNNLVSRVQPYGIKVDVLKAAGHAGIPETEALYAGEAAMFLKMISSGAHLYNRPVVSAEAFAHIWKDYMDTPMKLKMEADKLFVNGVNHLIYNTTPYVYEKEGYGPVGWNPFSSPHSGFAFSCFANEKSPFWPYIGKLNEYITRIQYALRAGKPKADILVYYPFHGFSSSFKYVQDHNEHLFAGDWPDAEPPAPKLNPFKAFFSDYLEFEESEQVLWLKNIWPVLQELEAKGYTWDWANDEVLQYAEYNQGGIEVQGNRYNGVLFNEIPAIELETAINIKQLSDKGAYIITVGKLPIRQHGFHNYKENDKQIESLMQEVEYSKNYSSLEDTEKAVLIPKNISYVQPENRVRHTVRQGTNWQVVFLTNTSNQRVNIDLQHANSYKYCYMLDASNGNVHSKDFSDTLVLEFEPYEAKLFYFSNLLVEGIPENLALLPIDSVMLGNWEMKTVLNGKDTVVNHFETKDWQSIDYLKYHSGEMLLNTHFEIENLSNREVIIEFEEIYGAVTIVINGSTVGSVLWTPYRKNIADFLKVGDNEITFIVNPPLRNGFIGKAMLGDKSLRQFLGKQNTAIASGIAGQVSLIVFHSN